MIFDLKKETGIIPAVLTQILDHCVNGITLSDPDFEDNPIVYANEAFEKITGYSRAEIIGKNCRFLQQDDRDQAGLEEIRAALNLNSPVAVTLKNYRKNGELFYNRLTIRPLYDSEGGIIYYLGLQYDVTKQVNAQLEIESLNNRIDRLNKGS